MKRDTKIRYGKHSIENIKDGKYAGIIVRNILKIKSAYNGFERFYATIDGARVEVFKNAALFANAEFTTVNIFVKQSAEIRNYDNSSDDGINIKVHVKQIDAFGSVFHLTRYFSNYDSARYFCTSQGIEITIDEPLNARRQAIEDNITRIEVERRKLEEMNARHAQSVSKNQNLESAILEIFRTEAPEAAPIDDNRNIHLSFIEVTNGHEIPVYERFSSVYEASAWFHEYYKLDNVRYVVCYEGQDYSNTLQFERIVRQLEIQQTEANNMTRDEILKEYDVDVESGVIKSPGKFEGEMVYVPYFWDAYLNGLADDDDGDVLTFEVTDEDRAQFPELQGVKIVRLSESDSGFVYSQTE